MTHGTPVRARYTNLSQGLAQWVARKLNNHCPAREHVAKFQRSAQYGIEFVAGTDQQKVLHTLPDGRRFLISVEEVAPETQFETEKFVHA